MRQLPLFLLLLVVGCAHTPPSAPAPAPKPAPVEVTIEHLMDRDAWRVRYAFPAAEPQVVFGRGGRSIRERWKVLEPADATLVADGERGIVRRTGGAPIDALVMGLEDDFEKPEKNYQPVIPYGDGGRLFYTGYIALDIPNDVFFTFVPRAGEHVVARGQRSGQPLRTDWVQNGTYAYFGKTEPRVTDAGLAVLDGAMPAWLREELERALPAFLAFYAQGTRQPLPTRPVIFMSYSTGALRRLVQQDCEANGDARAASSGAYVGGSGCRTLPPEARVVRVGELGWDGGTAVHQVIAARCAKGAPVRLTLEGGRTLDVPCQATLPPRRRGDGASRSGVAAEISRQRVVRSSGSTWPYRSGPGGGSGSGRGTWQTTAVWLTRVRGFQRSRVTTGAESRGCPSGMSTCAEKPAVEGAR